MQGGAVAPRAHPHGLTHPRSLDVVAPPCCAFTHKDGGVCRHRGPRSDADGNTEACAASSTAGEGIGICIICIICICIGAALAFVVVSASGTPSDFHRLCARCLTRRGPTHRLTRCDAYACCLTRRLADHHTTVIRPCDR